MRSSSSEATLKSEVEAAVALTLHVPALVNVRVRPLIEHPVFPELTTLYETVPSPEVVAASIVWVVFLADKLVVGFQVIT
jgi:hypothetical protein